MHPLTVNDFFISRPGSVLANFKLQFTPSANNVVDKIKDALKRQNFKVGPFAASSTPNSVYGAKGIWFIWLVIYYK